jgi:hypothetical protein
MRGLGATQLNQQCPAITQHTSNTAATQRGAGRRRLTLPPPLPRAGAGPADGGWSETASLPAPRPHARASSRGQAAAQHTTR